MGVAIMRICGVVPESSMPVTVVSDGSVIVAIEKGVNRPDLRSEDLYISAGMIDLMVPGYRGVSFRDSKLDGSDIRSVLQGLYARGTTHFCPLVGTTSSEAYEKILPTINEFAEQNREGISIIGIHIEGPYLSEEPGVRGAHNPNLMHDPDFEEFKHWYERSGKRSGPHDPGPGAKRFGPFYPPVTPVGCEGGHRAYAGLLRSAACGHISRSGYVHPLGQRRPEYDSSLGQLYIPATGR